MTDCDVLLAYIGPSSHKHERTEGQVCPDLNIIIEEVVEVTRISNTGPPIDQLASGPPVTPVLANATRCRPCRSICPTGLASPRDEFAREDFISFLL